MIVHWWLCFIITLIADKSTGSNLPLFLRPQNYTGHHRVTPHVNPCHNFYAYSCNAWISQVKKPPYEPVWNPWIATSHEIKHRLSKILTQHDAKLISPQRFYRSCVRIIEHETKYLQELTSLVENLGGWPMVNHRWDNSNYHWLTQLSRITRILGIHSILKIHANLDYKDPKKLLIYIEPGNLIFPQHILAGSAYGTELEAYEKWILDTANHMYSNMSLHINHEEVKEIIKFEMYLAKNINMKARHVKTTVNKISKKFSVDWLGILDGIFKGFLEVKPNTIVAIKNYAYLKNVFLLIDQIGDKVAANYLIWSVVKDLSRDTTHHMRDLNFLIDRAILGVKDDLSREYECLDKVIKYFSPLLVPQYLKLFVKPSVFPAVTSMTDSIKNEFIAIINKSSWLSQEAKLSSVGKIRNIKVYLGFPEEAFDGTLLEKSYQKLQMTSDHFLNMIELKRFKAQQFYSQFSENKSVIAWPSSPFDVNAYYSVLQNSVFIPLGLLEPPFFQSDRNETLNYGALGFLIGHEISHSLDPAGILADSTGKIGKWLPENDLAIYRKRIQCFGDSYIVGENIADVNGLRISLGAIKNRKSEKQNIEMFFLSFAQMWCEVSEETDIFANDEHAPNADRVQSLRYNSNFREAFECGSGSSCDLW